MARKTVLQEAVASRMAATANDKTLTIRLPDDLRLRLDTAALKQRVKPSELARSILAVALKRVQVAS